MVTLFEVLKGFFFFFTILIGIFFLRGYYVLSEARFQMIGDIIMPGYLLITGTVIGYIIGYFYILKNDITGKKEKEKVYVKAFLLGIIVGVLLSVLYIFNS